MRITRLELQNIGVFEHEIFDFDREKPADKAEIHIFTGVNGSGKSTILYALASPFNADFVKKRFRFKLKDSSCIRILYDYNEKEQTYNQYYYSNSKKPILYKFGVFGYSGFRSLSSVSLTAIKELTINSRKSLKFQDPVNSRMLLQWIANTKAKIAFASQDGNQDIAEKYRDSIERIENAVSQIVGYDVIFTFQYEPLSVGIRINGEELEFDVLPDGLKSVISWIADLLMRMDRLKWKDNIPVLERNFILFLDEIEIHLHPSWQRKILPVVQKLFKNAQIFIATHSPFVVASVSDAWIYKLAPVDGKMKLTEVVKSKAGISYPAVLDEIFDIDEYFDIQTEADFKQFYQFKDELLSDNNSHLEEFSDLSRRLSQKGIEVQDIIGRELRQLERITGKEFAL